VPKERPTTKSTVLPAELRKTMTSIVPVVVHDEYRQPGASREGTYAISGGACLAISCWIGTGTSTASR